MPLPPQPCRRRLLGGVASLLALPVARARAAGPPEDLVILTRGGPVAFTVELALTPAEQARGLMFRTQLAERHGMLFDFGADQPLAFWMRNTLIPLDMLFIDSTGTVRHIHAEATPLSEEPIPSRVPVRAVLEIIGGSAARLGIAVGDRARHRIFPRG